MCFQKCNLYNQLCEWNELCLNDIYGEAFNRDIWTMIAGYAYGTFTWIVFPHTTIAVNDPILPYDIGHANRMDFGVNTGIMY